MLTHTQKIKHLSYRAGFGCHPLWLRERRDRSLEEIVAEFFANAQKASPLNHIKDPLKGKKDKKVGNLKLSILFVRSFVQLRKLNLVWIDKMANDPAQLTEKMCYFWHDHFATQVPIAWLMQEQNNTIRKQALGSFRELVHAIAKDPAMLIYLNNQQNKKDAPNENFARELMELFTMGEGNYTEQDIKEAARAFTGWTVNRSGRYEFVEEEHDFGEKTFMGKTGNFGGEDIIEIILEQPETARFIVGKIYKYFVNDQPDAKIIEKLAEDFFQNDYEIGAMMKQIFLSDWFYDEKHVGALVKSPVELIVSLKKILGMEFRQKRILLLGQDALGQILFYPPNVSGWPHGRDWIDSSSLLFRMRMPGIILGMDEFDINIKPEYESIGLPEEKDRVPRFLKAELDWSALVRCFEKVPANKLAVEMMDNLVQAPRDHIDISMLVDFAEHSTKENLIKSLAIRIMALPEFQMC